MATDQTASMQRADLTPGLRQRLRAWIAAPMSRTTRGLLAFGGVILPLLWHAVVGTVASPSWQTGELHDMLAYVFTPRAGVFLYPMLLYSMISLAAYLIDEKNCGKQFFIRLGIWSGSAVMLWYCAVFAVTIGRVEPANPATLFTPLIVGAIQAGLLVAIWGIGLLARWLGQRIRLLVSALVLGIGALVLWIIIAIDVAAVFVVILLGVGLFCAPVWALLCFAFASARLVMVEPASRRASLLHWMLGMTWLAMFFGACRQAVVYSLHEYSQLPVKPPACYVATAAARGHRRWVKSFVRPDDPAGLAVNRQLQVLKAFEFLLCAISPSAHRLLRRVYDSAGPPLAKRIHNPWLADMAYVTLKPVEWGAAAVLWCWLGRERYLVGTLFRGRKK